jgi:uncharacterized protein with von Willebrand factor type A (vWA) domain
MRDKAKAEREYSALLESVSSLASSFAELNRQAVREYTPLVEGLLRSESRDAHQIETTLDGLLDFCGDDTALLLYRRLCRYYYGLDPAAAVHYVHSYRERWEESTEEDTQAHKQQDHTDKKYAVGKPYVLLPIVLVGSRNTISPRGLTYEYSDKRFCVHYA